MSIGDITKINITGINTGQATVDKQLRGYVEATESDSGIDSPEIPSWATQVWIGCKNTDFVFAIGEDITATAGIDVFAGQVLWPIRSGVGDGALHIATIGGNDTVKYTFLS